MTLFQSESNPKSPRTSRRFLLASLLLLVGLCTVIYVRFTSKTVESWDALAYAYAGERIAGGHGPTLCHSYNAAIGPYFTLAGFNVRVEGEEECLYLNYPIGFPLILAAARSLTGMQSAALYVPAVLGVLGLVATFALGTLLFEPPVGVLGSLILALVPTYMTFTTSLWSDVPGTLLLVAGIAAFLWGGRQERGFYQVVAGVVGAGLVGWSVFTRYANIVGLLPVVLYLYLVQRRGLLKDRAFWAFGGCMVLVCAGILLFNRTYYGGYFTTPYSPRHGWYAWPAFSLGYALGDSPVGGHSLLAAVQTVWTDFSWLSVPAFLGLAGMTLSGRALVLGEILVLVGLYTCYAFPARGINARFLLPAFPFISLAAGYGLWFAGPQRWRWLWRMLGVALTVVVLIVPLPGRLRTLAERNANNTAYVEGIAQLTQNTEPNAVILAYNTNDAIVYYGKRTTMFYRRIPSTDPETNLPSPEGFETRFVQAVNRLLEGGQPVYYVEDSNPPLFDSLALLQRHFSLRSVETTPRMYRVYPLGFGE